MLLEFHDQQYKVQTALFCGRSTSKSKKGKQSMSGKKILPNVDAIERVAKAIRKGNEYFKDAFKHLPMKENDIYAHLVEFGISKYLKIDCLFLVKHPDELSVALSIQWSIVKKLLWILCSVLPPCHIEFLVWIFLLNWMVKNIG